MNASTFQHEYAADSEEATGVADWDTMLIENRRWSRCLGLWFVAIYLALFLIRPWEVLVPWLAAIRFERMYAIAMVACVLMTGRMIRWNVQHTAIALFTAAVTLSAVFAWQPDLSWRWLYQFITVVTVYGLILMVCRTPSDLLLLINTYIGAMFLYLGKSLWEYIVHDRHEFSQSVPRLVGIETTYGEFNSLAMSIVVSLPFWLFMLRGRVELTSQWNRLWRSAYDVMVFGYPLMSLLAVWWTNSRAGMLGLCGFVVGAFFLRARQMSPVRAVVVCGILLAILWMVTPGQQQDRLRTLWDPNAGPANAQASANGRWEGFLASTQMLRDRPVFGVGVGNFLDYRVVYIDGVPLVAHNLPGQILGETGLLGGATFALMVFVTWHNCRTLRRIAKQWDDPAFFIYYELALACLLSLFLMFLFGGSLHNGLRYNWLWIAAFSSLALEFCRQTVDEIDESCGVEK